MFPQTRQCKKHSLNSSLKLAKTKNTLRHQSCNVNAHRVGRIDNTVGEVAAGNGLIWRYFEDFRELEFFGSGSLFLVGGNISTREF